MKIKADTWKKKCQAVSYLQVLSTLVFIFGLSMLALALLTKGGGHDMSDGWRESLLITIVGGAGIFGRKVTAVLFAVMSTSVAAFTIAPCFMTKPHPSMINSICVAVMFCIPALLTYRGWEALK